MGVQHTPGPWEVVASSTLLQVRSVDGIKVASTSWHSTIRKPYPLKAEAAANARLLAAAPELLTEAREICAILDLYRADTGEEPCFDHEAIGEEVARRHDSLTAALAKAGQEVGQ